MEDQVRQNPENRREEFIYLSTLYERTERFSDMVSVINKFIEMD